MERPYQIMEFVKSKAAAKNRFAGYLKIRMATHGVSTKYLHGCFFSLFKNEVLSDSIAVETPANQSNSGPTGPCDHTSCTGLVYKLEQKINNSTVLFGQCETDFTNGEGNDFCFVDQDSSCEDKSESVMFPGKFIASKPCPKRRFGTFGLVYFAVMMG